MTHAPDANALRPIDSALPFGRRVSEFVPWGAVEAIVITLAALALSLAIFGFFILFAGRNPFEVFGLMYKGAFGTSFAWGNTLTRAAPLLLAGLCTALPARLGMVIIGAEGAIVIGGLSAAILAHAERCKDLLHDPGAVEKLIRVGCLIQVNSQSVTRPGSATDAWALKDWFRRGVAHLVGSDGHSLRRRPPDLADAYHQIVRWTSREVADRVCSIYGSLVLQGMRINVPPPRPAARRWLPKLW